MKAIIETGSKQYTVAVGDKIRVEKLAVKTGETVEFPVLAVMDGKASKLGPPHVAGTSVTAKSLVDGKGKKVIVFKYKPKIGYRNKRGHRQPYTELEIISIGAVVKAKAAPASETAVSEAPKAVETAEKKAPAVEKTTAAKSTATAAKPAAAKSTATAAKTTAAKTTTAAKAATTTAAKKTTTAAKSADSEKKTTTAKSTATKTTTAKKTTAAETKES